MRFLDLSAPIASSPPDTLDLVRVEVDLQDHKQGAELIESFLGVGRELLRDGEGWANDEIRKLGTHSTTHVDAPRHYNSTIRGEPAAAIDESGWGASASSDGPDALAATCSVLEGQVRRPWDGQPAPRLFWGGRAGAGAEPGHRHCIAVASAPASGSSQAGGRIVGASAAPACVVGLVDD